MEAEGGIDEERVRLRERGSRQVKEKIRTGI